MSKKNQKRQQDIMAQYKLRWGYMKSARQNFEASRDIADQQVEASTFYDNRGKLMVNVPLEQNLLEISVWKELGQLVFAVEPDGKKIDSDELQPAKYALDFFLEDWNFYAERRQFTLEKWTYGTGIYYCGITQYKTKKYELKKDTEDDENVFFDNKNYNEFVNEKRIFTPKHVPLRHFWIDDRAVYSARIEDARDAIMQENISKEEMEQRWGDNKFFFNLDLVDYVADIDPQYNKQQLSPERIIIHYYFNKQTKDYWIIANYNILIFAGKYLYRHGELPFAAAQHYPRMTSFYGRGIPEKVRYIKAYKSQMLQNALDKVQMSSWLNIWIGNNGEVDWQLYTSAWEINVWRFTDSLQNVAQYQLDWNISSIVSILSLIDDFVIQDTWDNVKAPYSSPAGTLWEVEIMEENKETRQKAIDSAKDLCYDRALTMALENIAQFAPKLLLKETEVDGELKKREYPVIQIPNTVVKKEGGKTVYETDMWKYGYFELKPDTIKDWLRVRITMNSTKNALKTLEKNTFTQFIGNLGQIAQLKPEILQWINDQDIMDLLKTVYWYGEQLSASTKKDEIKQKNIEMIEAIKWTIWLKSLDANDVINESPQKILEKSTQSAMTSIPGTPQMPDMSQTKWVIPTWAWSSSVL